MQPEDTPRAAPQVVVVYGQANENQVLADELALDGFDVRLVYDPALFGEVDLVVFAHTSKRGAGLDALRALRPLSRAWPYLRVRQDRATAPSVGIPIAGRNTDVETHASRLRRKLAEAGAVGWVRSTWDVGYCLAPSAPPPTREGYGRAS
jgi:DNA-binding response OmpR family regulator